MDERIWAIELESYDCVEGDIADDDGDVMSVGGLSMKCSIHRETSITEFVRVTDGPDTNGSHFICDI